jgi:NADPH-ferrihemoprotein reductase
MFTLDSLDYTILTGLTLCVAAHIFKYVSESGDSLKEKARSFKHVSHVKLSIKETLKKHKKDYVVLYSSQTGTSQDYSSKFAKELSARFGLNVLLGNLQDYDFGDLNKLNENTIVSFFISTYGDGEFADDGFEFEKYLSSTPDLSNLKYTLFGFGNSSYDYFNGACKKASEYLERSKAKLVGGKVGLADDGEETIDEDYLNWKVEIFDQIKNFLNLTEHDFKFESCLRLEQLSSPPARLFLGEPDDSYLDEKTDLSLGPFDNSHPYLAPIIKTKNLFSSRRSCIHVEFDLSKTNLRYSTGDHVAVYPSNSDEKLNGFFEITGFSDKRDYIYNIIAVDSTVSISFPTPTTVESIFRYYKEISAPASRNYLNTLKEFVPNPECLETIDQLINDKDLYMKEILPMKFNFAQLLSYLSNGEVWNSLPLEYLIETVPNLLPRYYSVSSSSLSEKTSIHITAAVEDDERLVDRLITGVTTNLFHELQIKQNEEEVEPILHYELEGPRGKYGSPYKLPIFVSRSTFKLPVSPTAPIIMIGPGTGVAPFRGFIRDRVYKAKEQGLICGKSLLFYGCRSSVHDFLYKEEWEDYKRVLGDSFELVTAFSREGEQKVYVQDRMMEHAQEIARLVDNGAYIYVCGDAARMAKDVNKTLVKILVEHRGVSEEEAKETLLKFKSVRRYLEDVW